MGVVLNFLFYNLSFEVLQFIVILGHFVELIEHYLDFYYLELNLDGRYTPLVLKCVSHIFVAIFLNHIHFSYGAVLKQHQLNHESHSSSELS